MTAEASSSSTRCLICSAQATGFHFEAQSCSACAAFFRRTVALTKSFKCITGRDDCNVHYSMHQICRSCRHKKCLSNGMKPGGVQPKKPNIETGRAFFTKSGLKRNKKFANVSPQTADEQKLVVEGVKVPKIEVQEPNSLEDLEQDNEFVIKTPTPRKISSSTSFSASTTTNYSTPGPSPMAPCSAGPDVLTLFIREEMKLGERRRLLFSERAVGTLLGQNKHCPYKKEDIKPLVFHDFRLTIKTHIMLVYEWLQTWPELQELDDFDRMSLLRKAVLIHFLLDPSFLSYQIGEPDKLIMQNGGFISTADHHGVGWEDETDISGENKRKYYVPIMKQITDEIMPAMEAMKITFEEFVALKALACFQGGFENVSEAKRHLITQQVNRIMTSLHTHYLENSEEKIAERFGTIVLMLSNIFTAGNDFVQNHREIDIFHIWDLDKLVLQLLNLDKIMETEARETAEKRAMRNGINVVNNNNDVLLGQAKLEK
ncbi:Nuclear hormone receptor family member nhr-80 [Caenorhabditis elegans]|uniref:Isoform a of Nuclear hormone receptor family member nhr-80 n=1 Tax=Caenorhabditis elegans TaxID=6239 RepID=Q8ITW8-2|nr:Nuclear hormone receptor family member nhr-80 [Caenorhabditis elegans]AAO39183.1 nuclear receptor NHR-80 [Caenorhabditis elegans]CCD68270.1 Nuclear hormone receptor family member nhr-80 [Caenorhabditis elegans]|eukprot:NP_497126.1 Nuclear Hormone Receptor family [Caenorhabditis elegans]